MCCSWYREANWCSLCRAAAAPHVFPRSNSLSLSPALSLSAFSCSWPISLPTGGLNNLTWLEAMSTRPEQKPQQHYTISAITLTLYTDMNTYIYPHNGFSLTWQVPVKYIQCIYSIFCISYHLFSEAIWCLHWLKYSNPRAPSILCLLHFIKWKYYTHFPQIQSSISGIFRNFGISTRI